MPKRKDVTVRCGGEKKPSEVCNTHQALVDPGICYQQESVSWVMTECDN